MAGPENIQMCLGLELHINLYYLETGEFLMIPVALNLNLIATVYFFNIVISRIGRGKSGWDHVV